MKKFLIFLLIITYAGVYFFQSPVVHAGLPKAQKEIYDRKIKRLNVGCDKRNNSGLCSCQADGNISGTLPSAVPEPHNGLFTAAADKYGVNPQYVAVLFLSENSNEWRPFNYNWGTSPAQAQGPFQFVPGTWDGYGVDGDNDGNVDINNMQDAAYSAANYIKSFGVTSRTPLGSISTPFKPGTFLHAAASYNWGPGNVQMNTTANSDISVAPVETQNYLKNVYELITSGFTKGGGVLGDPSGSGGGGESSGSSSTTQPGCSGGVVAGDIVQTALNLAWDTEGHGKEKSHARREYQEAMPRYNGSTGTDEWSDCGVFVATVMIASGADPDYPKRITWVQQPYLDAHPEKYENKGSITSTAELKPGDILINSGHTYLYIGGDYIEGYNSLSASLHTHVPEADNFYPGFTVYRLK